MTQARAETLLQNRRACPYEVEPKLKGLSQERSCHKNLELIRACPKSGHVPRILKGKSQERACPKSAFQWHLLIWVCIPLYGPSDHPHRNFIWVSIPLYGPGGFTKSAFKRPILIWVHIPLHGPGGPAKSTFIMPIPIWY